MFTTASGALLARATTGSSFATIARVSAVAFAVALTAAAAQVTAPVPFTAVPFALTPLAVLLTGAALGPRLGAAAQVAYILAGIAGLPVFAPSAILPSGMLRLLGPTGGYLMAYPLAACAAGWLAERGWDRRYVSSALAMLAGLGVIFCGGVAWLVAGMHQTLPAAIMAGVAPFIAIDVLKVMAAAMILPKTWALLGRRDR